MNSPHVKYLLVGGGVASWSAARAIRALDREGSVLLVGREINRPYHRAPLSKSFLRRQSPREAMFLGAPEWFVDHHVELRTGRRVVHLDLGRQAAALDSGEEIAFDRLLLATGASPIPLPAPGADLPNVFTLRSLADAGQIHNAVEKARREGRPHERGRGRVAVIGAGLLGVELAGSFTELGLKVDLIESGALPWTGLAGEATGRFLVRHLERKGVAFHPASAPRRLEGDGRVQRIALDGDGQIDCDFTVAVVGAAANKEVLRGSPIHAEKAILVDDHCRTNVPHVYAAGDCCAMFDPLYGKHRWVDHAEHAERTGALAGRNMAGADEAYRGVCFYATSALGLDARIWGDARFVDRRLLRGAPHVDAPDFIEIGLAADGRVAQVIAVGHAGEDEVLRELVARRFQADPHLEALNDPAASLVDLLNPPR